MNEYIYAGMYICMHICVYMYILQFFLLVCKLYSILMGKKSDIWMPALREVDLEPSAKRGTNKTRVPKAFTDCLKACILNSLLTKSQRN